MTMYAKAHYIFKCDHIQYENFKAGRIYYNTEQLST